MTSLSNHRTDEELWQIVCDPGIWPGMWVAISKGEGDLSLAQLLRKAHKASQNDAPDVQGVKNDPTSIDNVIDIPSVQVRRLWHRLGLAF